jgi:hypothetical protein
MLADSGDALVPLADIFNHKAAVVHLAEGFVVGEVEDRGVPEQQQQQQQQQQEDEEDEEEEEGREDVGLDIDLDFAGDAGVVGGEENGHKDDEMNGSRCRGEERSTQPAARTGAAAGGGGGGGGGSGQGGFVLVGGGEESLRRHIISESAGEAQSSSLDFRTTQTMAAQSV